MARKSAYESLRAKLEESQDSGVTDVDITVVIEADGDGADDALAAAEIGEADAEASAIAESSDAAQQEAEDMAEMAIILRKYGLNAGMAAMLNVLMPLEAYNITLPACESLDANGRNQQYADRLADSLQVANEGFWDSVTNFLKKIWLWISDQLSKLGSLFGNLKKKIERAGAALKERTFNPERNKNAKKKVMKDAKITAADYKGLEDVLRGGPLATSVAARQGADESEVTNYLKKHFNETWLKECFGLKLKDPSKTDSFSLEDADGDFCKTDESEVVQADVSAYATDGKEYNKALEFVGILNNISSLNKNYKKAANDIEQQLLNDNILAKADSDTVQKIKKGKSLAMTLASSLQKITTRGLKSLTTRCKVYISGARTVLSCTTQSGVNKPTYSD